MKQKFTGFVGLSLALALLCGCSSSTTNATTKTETDVSSQETAQTQTQTEESSMQTIDAAALVADIPTTQYFTEDAVADEDLEQILLAGVNAPSAMNGQPWHFSVVTDDAVLQDISDEMSAAMTAPPAGATAPADAETEDAESPEADTEESTEASDAAEQSTEDTEAPAEESEDTADAASVETTEDTAIEDTETDMTAEEAAGEEAETEMPAPAASAKTKAGLTDAPAAIIISCADGSELDAGLACQNMSVEAQLLGYGTKILSSPTIALNGSRQAEFYEQLGVPEGYTVVAVLLIGVEDTSVDTTADTYTGATERNPLDEVVTYIKPE